MADEQPSTGGEPAWSAPGAGAARGPEPRVLFAIVFVIATSGLIYELGMAAVASYVLGDTVSQFSLVIGVYLSALGLGAYLSRFVGRRLALTFVDVELATALLGGLSAPALLLSAGSVGAWELLLYLSVAGIGTLVGLELPLLIRALSGQLELKELIAKALTFDYVGALCGSLAFSLWLVPKLGLTRSAIACGLLNAFVAFGSTYALAGLAGGDARGLGRARIRAALVIAILALGWVSAERWERLADRALYPGRVVHAEQSRYQRIVLAEQAGDLRLYLNGNLQFSSRDEHRYHEALVHPALAAAKTRRRVLIGGGGDGLALREVLRWPELEQVTLVDLDPAMIRLFSRDPRLTALNRGAFASPKLSIVNDDAGVFVKRTEQRFDVAILDFPDPSQYAIGKLYSLEMYRDLGRIITPEGVISVQATSPLFARAAFWCIERTLARAGFRTLPYHVFVPAFGAWGFVLASPHAIRVPDPLPVAGLRYLDAAILRAALVFPPDMAPVDVAVNRIENQALVRYYAGEFARWN